MGYRLRFRIPFGQFVDLLCQIRRCRTTDGLPNISTHQSLHSSGGRLDSLLDGTAGAVRSHRRVVSLIGYLFIGRIQVTLTDELFSGGLKGSRIFLRFRPLYLTLRPRDIPNLASYLPYQLKCDRQVKRSRLYGRDYGD
ncbi:hypothetical protein AAGR22_08035 [Erwinia sp. HDF1-3R]|uniref:hypothetical protein n=1 Tax=Erwinia sp. HDF1-3R TaxID=3141543 RepID=UPI0031F507C7